MKLYCVLGIQYLSGFITIPTPKIYSIHQTREEALKQYNELKYLGDDLYIDTIELS